MQLNCTGVGVEVVKKGSMDSASSSRKRTLPGGKGRKGEVSSMFFVVGGFVFVEPDSARVSLLAISTWRPLMVTPVTVQLWCLAR